MRVAVIGAGSWGTAVASLAARNADVRLWARRPELADAITQTRQNPDYLDGFTLPDRLTATSDLEEAVSGAEAVVIGVPSHGFRSVLTESGPYIASGVPIVSLTKGIERDSLKRMTQVVLDVLDHPPLRVGVLSGPNLAREVMAGQPAATVIAIPDEWEATRLQNLFMGPAFRVYTNPDVVGAEAAGALKNVMAIAAGMARGLGYGDNSIAALITRALAELTRLGVALGGEPLTFAGLAGMGDLVATCTSPLSRNRTVGVALGEGKTLDEVITEMRMVAEGVKTTEAVLSIAEQLSIEMPIARMVGRVLYEGMAPIEMVQGLMGRAPKAELHGIA